MSGPYNSYNQGYPSQYPAQGYNQPQYPPQYPPQSQYPPQGYNQQPYGGPQDQNFGPPRRADSFGPPQHGGFQHGQAGNQFGQYDASNPQGHAQYYGATQPYSGGLDAYAQNQQYQAQLASGTSTQPGMPPQGQQQYQQGVQEHQFQPQSSDPNAPNYDPNAPPMTEGERGLLGAMGGGVGGYVMGKKAGHGFLGTVGGAILGSLTEDFAKKQTKQHHHKHGSHHGSQSSWGGGRW